jgi:Xaa-Pro aminopeptidase
MLLTDPVNIAYVTGFRGVFDGEDAHAVLVTGSSATIFTDGRYATALRAHAEPTEWSVEVVEGGLYSTICDLLSESGPDALVLEANVPYGRFRFLSERFSGRIEVVDGWVEEIRQVKDARELESIASAAALTDRAFDHVLPFVRAGVSEWEVALELEFFMRREGSDGVAFPAIVASGPNSALPHARVTRRVMERGDFVKMDFGARVDGYCADMTRTVVIGSPSERHREVYDAVLRANEAGIAAVMPGLQGSVIDAAARDELARSGFAERFTHGLGHGVGLEVHELPHVGPRGTKSVLEGSVITVEPGVYLPGFGGVRIEDLVIVEAHGARVLTSSTKELLEV